MKVINTACPRNCYSTCSFKVWVDNDSIVKIEPQPENKATPEGVCIKGLSYIERAHSDKRISSPLKKTSKGFVPISWKEALKEIGKQLNNIKQKHGSHAVFTYAASGMSGLLNTVFSKFWELYGGTTTVYGNLCWPAGLEATRLTLGENKHNVAWDISNAKLIILWGKNPAETNIHQMVFIEKTQQEGAKLVVIDPRRTPSAERADLLIQPKPGTDGLLALYLAKYLIQSGNINTKFIEDHVLGFPEFSDSINHLDLDNVYDDCGVKKEFLLILGNWLAESAATTIVPGYGMQRYANGGQTIRCLLAICAITGNIGKSGAGWHYADLQSDIFSAVKEPESYFPNQENDGVFRREIPTALLGETMLKLKSPELKMAWVERGNPLSQNPDSNKIKEAFSKLDFVVVVDQFLTDTAEMADIVLPAKNMFEQSDVITSYWNPYIQLRQKVSKPYKETKPETEIYYLLAKEMGFSEEKMNQLIPFNQESSTEKWLSQYLEKVNGPSLESLKSAPVIAPKLQEIAFSDFKFNTPSGKIELLSEEANDKWGVNTLPDAKLPNNNSYPFQLLSPNTKDRIHSQFGNLDSIKVFTGQPVATINYGDAQSRNIKDNDSIRVFNELGELTIPVKTDGSIRPGLIVIHNGNWHKEGACPNILIKGRETDMGHGTAFHDTFVNYELV